GIDYFGLAGVSVETEEQGAFGQVGTVSRGPVGRQVDQFELWYLRQPQGGSFEVWIDGRAQDVVSTDADEPTAGYRLYRVPDGPHQLRIVARGDGLVRAFGVVMERDASGVVLDTLGINGARARLHLQWNDDLYREHLARRQPDLVVLAYGTNESGDPLPIPSYEAQLRRVLRRIRDVVPSSSCLLVGPSDRPVQGESGAWEALPRVQEINETQRRLALEFGCGYFDLLAFMGGPLSMVDWVALDFGARDHIHLTAKGYRRLAEELFAAMMEGFSPEFAAGDLPLTPQTVFQE
ncbi:MAG: GDSL-type esterase/lipase family protein, partial [Myxococcota bacterium]